jgi:hypothetical protein
MDTDEHGIFKLGNGMRKMWNGASHFPFHTSRFTLHASRFTMPTGDARPVRVAGRHLEVDLVADADADEIFAYLAGNVRENPVSVGKTTRNIAPGSIYLMFPVYSIGSSLSTVSR